MIFTFIPVMPKQFELRYWLKMHKLILLNNSSSNDLKFLLGFPDMFAGKVQPNSCCLTCFQTEEILLVKPPHTHRALEKLFLILAKTCKCRDSLKKSENWLCTARRHCLTYRQHTDKKNVDIKYTYIYFFFFTHFFLLSLFSSCIC